MEGANDNENDNSTLPSFTRADIESPGPSKAKACSSSSSQSRSSTVPSDLVAGTKLLTREEECTLKTALAFVVLKARAKARAAAALGRSHAAAISENHRIAGDGGAAHGHHGREASVLDHLFCHPGNSNGGNHHQNPPRSLECTTRGRKHIDYMFRAAKTLAETWVARSRNRNPRELQPVPQEHSQTASVNTKITSKALVGATGHLAHQLQLLLVANRNPLGNSSNHHQSGVVKPSSVTPSSLATGTPTNKTQQAAVPTRRYRKSSVSSKSAADSSTSTSTPTPSLCSRKGGDPVVVTPATIGRNSSNSTNHPCGGTSQNETSAMGAVVLVQGWIRSTLLQQQQQEDHREQAAANAERTVLSCQTTTVLDVLASFHVYTVMIPQIARISPPLIGHVFQVVARLARDLYEDRIAVIGENTLSPTSGGGEHGEGDLPTMGTNGNGIDTARQLLNHLATSALELLELCWTTEIGVGHSRSKESHRSFLLLSLQGILGHLLVPLPRSELAGEHYRLAVAASQYLAFQQRRHYQQQLVQQKRKLPTSFPQSLDSKRHKQARHQSEASPCSNTARKDARNENAVSTKFQGSRASSRPSPKPNGYVGGCLLDPEAKLFLRMAVYRLILMGNKG